MASYKSYNVFEVNLTEAKKEIRKAQRRLRNAPEFMKNVATNMGIERLTTRGNANEVAYEWRNAKMINEMKEFTKSGFKAWKKELANDTRLSIDTIDYAISQLSPVTMDYIANSKLRYGSNPQLDYIADNASMISGSLQNVLDEIKPNVTNVPLDIF